MAYSQADPTAADDASSPSLPAPSEGADERTTELKLGAKVALDHLGPAIVTERGTLRRIANWEELSEAERAAAWRRVKARNRVSWQPREKGRRGCGGVLWGVFRQRQQRHSLIASSHTAAITHQERLATIKREAARAAEEAAAAGEEQNEPQQQQHGEL